jgi:competence protein ComGC
MKLARKNSGLTLVEVLVVIIVFFVLAILFAPCRPVRAKAQSVACMSNLKQVQLSFRLWAQDNNDRFPMEVSTNNGGAMEPAVQGNLVPLFEVMSQELNTPKILSCPADMNCEQAVGFSGGLRATNISYLVNLDATVSNWGTLLMGDRNLVNDTPGRHGIFCVSSNQHASWTPDIHDPRRTILLGAVKLENSRAGNITLTDGRNIQRADNSALNQALRSSRLATNRLILP